MRVVALLILVALVLGLLLRSHDEPAEVPVFASDHEVASVNAYATQRSLGEHFDELVAAYRKPAPRARTAPKRSLAAGAIPDLIRRVFARFGPVVAEQAVRVSGCETGGRYDPAVVNASGHTGLFQLSPRYHAARAARLGFSWARMREAEPNALVAADLYAEQGWGPWTCRYAA